MFSLNVHLQNAPTVVLMFKERQAAEVVEKLIFGSGVVDVHDNFSVSACIDTSKVAATVIGDIEKDLERQASIETMRAISLKRAEADIMKHPLFSQRPANPFGIPAKNG